MSGTKKTNKKIIVYCPLNEFHSFFKCNIFLSKLKEAFKDTEIICAIPEKAIGTITEADELIITSNEYMDAQGINIPEILDIVSDGGRENSTNRFTDTIKFIEQKYKNDDYRIIKYGEEEILDLNNNRLFRDSTFYSTGKRADRFYGVPNDPNYHWRRDFSGINEFVSNGNFLKPEFETFMKIKNKYESIFNEKTYIIITRNFNNKQPETNTLNVIPQLKEIIPMLLNNGINIVNIGFPPQEISEPHKNYTTLSEDLTQDELMSLFYLSSGIILSGENAGFSTHAPTMNDLFIISKEWSMHHLKTLIVVDDGFNSSIFEHDFEYSIEAGRNESGKTDIKTNNLIENISSGSYDSILKTFKNHKKVLKQEFLPTIKKTYMG